MQKRILIVGGVAGGATAAARLRRLDEEAEIIIFERGGYISFANCGLPYYIGGVIPERDSLLLQTVESFSKRYALEVRVESEVTEIKRAEKEIIIHDLKTNNHYSERYDHLILSPGAKPALPPIPGLAECTNAFTLRDMSDTDAIKNYIIKNRPKKAAVIGAGFIGLEMAENLEELGVKSVVLEQAPQVMQNFDFEMAQILHEHLRENGVELRLGAAVERIHNQGREIELAGGEKIATDLIIVAAGVRPETHLATEAGLRIGVTGGIAIDELLMTDDENIFALGDATESTSFIGGNPCLIPLAWPANRQARLVADTILLEQRPYRGTLGTSCLKLFQLTAASVGQNEKQLKLEKKNYRAVNIHPNSHAGYYPGALTLSLKMLFDPEDGKIYGAQAVGAEFAEKKIDVLATALKLGATIYDLQDLELCYAPPYSSAKDAVNMLGYVAANISAGLVRTVDVDALAGFLASGGMLIDVRDPEEAEETGEIPGSIMIPLDQLRDNLEKIPAQPICTYCQVGMRGYLAARILELNGFDSYNLNGGYQSYADLHGIHFNARALPLQREPF